MPEADPVPPVSEPDAQGGLPWRKIEAGVAVTLLLAVAGGVAAGIAKFSRLEGRLDTFASGDGFKAQTQAAIDRINLAGEAVRADIHLPDLPVGTVIAYAGSMDIASLESGGWLPCSGQEVSAAKYGGLCAVLSTKWGQPEGLNACRLPDLNGRFLRGTSAVAQVGFLGGAETVDHTHHIEGTTEGMAKTWGPKLKEVRPRGDTLSQESGQHSHDLQIDTSSASIPVLPPYASVYFLIKAIAPSKN